MLPGLSDLCSQDIIVVKTQSSTRTAGGAAIKSWSDSPRNLTGNVQGLTAEEVVAFGVRAGNLAWKIYFDTNPSITEKEHVWITDAGQVIETSVVRPSRQFGNSEELWIVVIEKFGPSA